MKLTILAGVLLWAAGVANAGDAQPLSGPWKHQDIGAVETPGTAALDKGVFTVKGTLDTWGTNDGFHFAFRRLHGDGAITARVLTVENTANHAKAGVMFREDLTAGARHAQACLTPVDGTQLLVRTTPNDKTSSFHGNGEKGKLPYWVRITRAGEKFAAYESPDGKSWTVIGTTNIPMSAEVYVGVTSSSHQKTRLGTATLDSVTVETK